MPTRPKNIVICSDGTGNTAIKDRGTNVFKLFEAIDISPHPTNPELPVQIAIYDDGVGTESFLPLKLIGGAFGYGLKRNVLDLYTSLVRIYEPGDRIFLFGFSRGAFTVRTLAGLIAKCGVLDWRRLNTTEEMTRAVKNAYDTYRKGYKTWASRALSGKSRKDVEQAAATAMLQFRQRAEVQEARIHFIGVWDTVDSVGGPFHIADVINTFFHRFKFPDRKLSGLVDHAVQALSIDDARSAFEPVLWADNPNVEQVWFAGVHANVGGGYPKQGMSLVTLDWMMEKARAKGLRILAADLKGYGQHGSVDDKLYDSRAGLGVFYEWKPRDMERLTRQQEAEWPPKIHMSVFERLAHGTGGYAPGTLAAEAEVVFTPSGHPEWDHIFDLRAKALTAALKDAFITSSDDLKMARRTVLIGRISYWVYVAMLLPVAFAFLSVMRVRALHIFRVLQPVWWMSIAAAGFLVAAICAHYLVDNPRTSAFSRFWHCARQNLREALQLPQNDQAKGIANSGD